MSKRAQLALFIFVNYVIIRFLYGNELEKMMPFGTYIFEVLFVFFTLFIYKEKFQKPKSPTRQNYFFYLTSFVLGLGTHLFAKTQGIVIPFDLSSSEAILFLLIVGPILEELIFRQTLWFTLQDLLKDKWLVLISTSALFAYAHFHAYWNPELLEFKRFIIYQTAYTFIIGLWWGLAYMRSRNITHPVLLHFSFNFGFWFAYFL